jgi:hypothetical protein
MRTSILLLTALILVGCSDINLDPVGPDNQSSNLPHVAITNLQDGDILGKDIYGVGVKAYHQSGIAYVQLKIGLKDVRLDYNAPYSFVWIVSQDAVVEGDYELCAIAVDNQGNNNRHCIKVKVKY